MGKRKKERKTLNFTYNEGKGGKRKGFFIPVKKGERGGKAVPLTNLDGGEKKGRKRRNTTLLIINRERGGKGRGEKGPSYFL